MSAMLERVIRERDDALKQLVQSIALHEKTGARHDNAQQEADRLRAERDAASAEVAQLRVQLAGCSVAATGFAIGDNDAEPHSYGWSASYQDVKDLRHNYEVARADNDRLRALLARGADLMPLDDTVTMTSRADWREKVREELVRRE
jgi:uncharacterized protein YneR